MKNTTLRKEANTGDNANRNPPTSQSQETIRKKPYIPKNKTTVKKHKPVNLIYSIN